MDYPHSKYELPENEKQQEVLPNKLGITSITEIHKAEFEGFLKTQYKLLEQLSSRTVFDVKYIFGIHKMALDPIYAFAGKLRTVNMTKGGFLFPTAKFLPSILDQFNRTVLKKMPRSYQNKEALIHDIAKVHAELLFIHPFREANGRVARVLANLMAIKQGYDFLDFYKTQREFDAYVHAVQSAANEDYQPMTTIIRSIF